MVTLVGSILWRNSQQVSANICNTQILPFYPISKKSSKRQRNLLNDTIRLMSLLGRVLRTSMYFLKKIKYARLNETILFINFYWFFDQLESSGESYFQVERRTAFCTHVFVRKESRKHSFIFIYFWRNVPRNNQPSTHIQQLSALPYFPRILKVPR